MIDSATGKFLNKISLYSDGFSSRFNMIDKNGLAVIADVKGNKYSIIDLAKGSLIKTYRVNVPIKDVKIADRIMLFE